MSRRDDDNTTTRNAIMFGGGALAAFLLLRGFGSGGGGGDGNAAGAGSSTASAPTTPPRAPCNVFIRGDRFELDGAPSDFANAVAACRTAGGAHIRTSGDTRQGVLDDLIRALLASGVTAFGGPDGLIDDVNRVRATMTGRRS